MPETLVAPKKTEEEKENARVREGLVSALELLRKGWTQRTGSRINERGGRDYCSLGAIWEVKDDDPLYFAEMTSSLRRALGLPPGEDISWSYRHEDGRERLYRMPDNWDVARWNDAPERTFEHVEAVFLNAIEAIPE